MKIGSPPSQVRWLGAVIAALALGASCARGYATLAAPYYEAVARVAALGHPWDVTRVEVRPNDRDPGTVLRLVGSVHAAVGDHLPAIRVVSTLHVGAAVAGPVVFWTLLLLWPAHSLRQRLVSVAVGIVVFLGVEAGTTAAQLIDALPQASAMLEGERDPVTAWERWSRFLEAGGRFTVDAIGALLAATIARWLTRIRNPITGTLPLRE